jgi:hypothetical protein
MTDISTQRVGFVGLGDQGGPMALAIIEAGFLLHAWARRHNPTTPWAPPPSSGKPIWNRLPAR